MKKLILLLSISLLYTGFLSAEREFQSVLNNGMARWSMVNFASTTFYSHDVIVADRDTLINGVLYRKIYHCPEGFLSNTDWQNHMPNINHLRYDSNRFIRENENASRLYVFDTRKNTEIVIFDLNLEVGDKFVFTYFNKRFGIRREVITHVDSVFIKYGLKHISFDYYFDSSCFIDEMKLTFIEGVGPNIGIEDPAEWWWTLLRVNCFQNDFLFYIVDHWLACCGCRWVNMPKIYENSCSVWLENGSLKISCELFQDTHVSIYDIFGRRQFNESFSNLQHLSIPTAHFPRGVYVLRVFDKNTNRTYTNKIIL